MNSQPDMSGPPLLVFSAVGDSFQLRIQGYEFPNPAEDDDGFELNWLVVQYEIELQGRRFQDQCACLLTWEVDQLADWFDSISRGKPSAPAIGFMEPDLHFEYVGASGSVCRICISAPMAEPSLGPAMPQMPKQEICAVAECNPDELVAAAINLRQQLSRFPPRGDISPYLK